MDFPKLFFRIPGNMPKDLPAKPQIPDTTEAEPIPEAARAEIERLLQTGDLFRYSSGEAAPVTQLELEFAEMMGVQYAVAVASCSAAIFLSLKALGLTPGARVLIPAFTFAAVPSAVVHAECVPVLVECGANYRIDLVDFEAKLEGADAVLISHMRGHTSDMDAIMSLAEARGLPVIEDAAHSLGTLWDGRKIGTIGKIGCFSFQSYKLLNAGEGGMLITDDPEIAARAVIMSGAYEHNWKKHALVGPHFAKWQNKLPLYNTRLGNLSAAVLRPQLAKLPRRVRDGRTNHDYVAEKISTSPLIEVPEPLVKELRAPDSLQFNLVGLDDQGAEAFAATAAAQDLTVQIFGLSTDNARAFWNWQFLPDPGPLPQTREMLMRACDVRLPARLSRAECDAIAEVLLAAAASLRAAA